LLKIAIEERLGFPVQLVDYTQLLNQSEASTESFWDLMVRGEIDIYPEVIVSICVSGHVYGCSTSLQDLSDGLCAHVSMQTLSARMQAHTRMPSLQ
jgi:hypothetical protein